MNEVDQHVGAQIGRHRRAQGIPLEQLAEATGIPVASLAAVEAGTRRASAEELFPICQLLRVRPGDLFDGYPFDCGSG